MKYFGSGGISHLDALTRQGRVCNSRVCVRLVQVETVEVQSDEADLCLALAHLDVAGGGGGLRPVGQILTVGAAAVCYEVTTDSEASSA